MPMMDSSSIRLCIAQEEMRIACFPTIDILMG